MRINILSTQIYTARMCINLLLHGVVPNADFCMDQQILESVTAFNTFQNAVHRKVGQIRLAAAHECGAARLDGTQPIIRFIV